ncbi:MAG: delta-60 repeat domain-containing protein [Desulfobulbaceae bacterium]|jgi:uncharacterized delta-60 repeat protein|nr:delta-60 repeat domain-containing protein [Desulfobulbaceae bacterium]
MKAWKTIPLGGLITVLLLAGLVAAAEIGRLDASFGSDGRVVTAPGIFADQAYAVRVQPDGRILVAGSSSNGVDLDFALIRLTQDGQLDPTFNFNGIVTTQVGSDDDEIAAIAVQDDGYIVAAGYSMNSGSRDFALARYTPDGQLDPSFGEGGIVQDGYGGGNDEITALAVDPEGRLVIAGYTTGTAGRAVIAGRYLSSGAPDPSFGDNGQSLIGIGRDALARGIDIDEQGRIILAGSFFHENRTEAMALRFTENGQLDGAFGVEGLAVPVQIGQQTEGYGIRIGDDGSILIAGSISNEDGLDSALFRFTESGRPDAGFGVNGMLVVSAAQEDDMVLAVDVLDGVIVASGFAVVDGVREFLLISHSRDAGDQGVSFALNGGGGSTGLQINELQVADSYGRYASSAEAGRATAQTTIVTTPFGYFSDDISYGVAVQPDGRAVAAGLTEENDMTSFAVARYASARALENEFASSSSDGARASWLETREPLEVTRNSAISGGVVESSGNTVTRRGVVFSIAPDPILREVPAGTDTSTPPPSASETGAPLQTGQPPAGTTSATLELQTGENALSRYAAAGGPGLRPVFPMGGLLVGTAIAQDTTPTPTPAIGNSAMTVTTTDTPRFAAGDSVFDLSTPQYALEGFTEDGAGTGAFSSILTDLRPSTVYYVRAYAVTGDGKIFYGNQIDFKTTDACFIATAAYGSLFHPCVTILRDFRDRFLLTNAAGQYLVAAYYQFSPPAAEFIADHPALRRLVQVGLLPVVGFGWLTVHYGTSLLLFAAFMILGSGFAVRAAGGRKK